MRKDHNRHECRENTTTSYFFELESHEGRRGGEKSRNDDLETHIARFPN